MVDTARIAETVRSLSADDIRARLDEIHAESQALRVLLRAAVQRDRYLGQGRAGDSEEASRCT